MAEKKTIVMQIAGGDYKVTASESEEHLRQIEVCVNDKIRALRKLLSVQGLSDENLAMLTAINLADDYLKTQKQLKTLQTKVERLTQREKELEEAALRYENTRSSVETENQEYAEQLKKDTEA